jgi:hypothetical protein
MGEVFCLEDGYPQHRNAYEWKSGTVNIAGATADTNIRDIGAFNNLFDTVSNNQAGIANSKRAHRVIITSSGTLYVRLNSATNDKITVNATTPLDLDLICEAIFVTSGGVGVVVTVILT